MMTSQQWEFNAGFLCIEIPEVISDITFSETIRKLFIAGPSTIGCFLFIARGSPLPCSLVCDRFAGRTRALMQINWGLYKKNKILLLIVKP